MESHQKNLILNASAIPPFDSKAAQPTEFYIAFLAKKSLFKAKDFLVHCFTMDRIAFNPGTSFISGVWNSNFFWTLPDTTSGVSIFFCPETKSLNVAELEKEKTFALADKVKTEDLNKISKQKMYLPSDIMDLVWMTQNFHAVISLIFGPQSHSASFLLSWASHMYDNRLIYSSLYGSDPAFFAQVLFSIDSILQIHWRSCCNTSDRLLVNDKVLLMQDQQDMLLHHNFIQ